MGNPTSLVLVSLAALALFCFASEAARINGPFKHSKVHVMITNNLPGGPTLTVHCQSDDDDLGFHSIGPGAFWPFQFRPNVIIKNTLFFCSFQWPGQFHYFDVYVEHRDDDRCQHNCLWSVVQDGLCLFNVNNGKYDICSPWNSSLSSRLPLPGSSA